MRAAITYRNYLEEIDKKITCEKHNCLYIGCTSKAIDSHSIQKRGPLANISDNNLVYCLESSLSKAYDVRTGTSNIGFKKTPVSRATTFPGFCDKHDKLFNVFELPGLDLSNKKHLLYLYYRTLGYELVRQIIDSKRRATILGNQYLSHSISAALGLNTFESEADFKKTLHLKASYCEDELFPLLQLTQSYIEANKIGSLQHLTRSINKNLGVACSSCTYISREHFSEFRNTFPNEDLPTVTFNVVPKTNETDIIISWDEKYNKHSIWLRKEFERNFEQLLNDFIFYRSEDICIAPSVWEDNKDIQSIVKETGHIFDPNYTKNLGVLKI